METFRELDVVDVDVVEAERTLTRLTIEVDVAVVHVACPLAVAKLIVEDATPVFKGMHHVVLMEQGEHTEDARLVHRQLQRLYVGKTCWVVKSCQSLIYKDAVCRWLHSLAFQS